MIYTPLTVPLPPSIDMRRYSGGVEQQGNLPSCRANAVVSACEIILERAGQFIDLSRIFNHHYNLIADQAAGTEATSTLKAIINAETDGLPPESVWPYGEGMETITPPPIILQMASARKIDAFESIDCLKQSGEVMDDMRSALAEGCPIVIGMHIGTNFMTLKGDDPHQNYRGGADLGNHAMVVCGYQPGAYGALIVENSWGTDWGDQGYWYLAQYLLPQVIEAYVIRSFAGYDTSARKWILKNQQSVRNWVASQFNTNPQAVIDACVECEWLPSELEWLMGLSAGWLERYRQVEGAALDWSKWR